MGGGSPYLLMLNMTEYVNVMLGLLVSLPFAQAAQAAHASQTPQAQEPQAAPAAPGMVQQGGTWGNPGVKGVKGREPSRLKTQRASQRLE